MNSSRPVRASSFASDNAAGASPQVLAALAQCGSGAAAAYGADDETRRVERRLAEIFETELSVFLVATGSAANALCLSAMTPPWGAVLCHPDGHVNTDECGAPEFFSGGAKLIAVGGAASKIDAQALRQQLQQRRGDVHFTPPACVSITQATEAGTLYSLDEVHTIGAICREAGVRLHMDGARFANALVALDATPAQLTWQAGVDALSFGATKNGVLAAEAIVLFDRSLDSEMAYRRKRAGHLLSKMRLLSVQMNAYLENDLWLANARHANAMARRLEAGLATIGPIRLHAPVEANMLFCSLPAALGDGLVEQGFGFYRERWGPGSARLVTSFATTADDVDGFVEAARRLAAG